MPVALRQTFASSFARLHEGYLQRFVRTDKMIIRSPPFQVSQQLWRLLSRSPGAACERCYAMSDGQIHPVLATWHIRSQNLFFSKNGCAK